MMILVTSLIITIQCQEVSSVWREFILKVRVLKQVVGLVVETNHQRRRLKKMITYAFQNKIMLSLTLN